jgi:hypothetical protein
MPVHSDHTASEMSEQFSTISGDEWASEILARLPSNLASKAAELKAFLQPRGFQSPTAMLRGLLVYALNPFGYRWLGAWGVLTGTADLSHTAWRNALLRSSLWLLWLIGELMVSSSKPLWITHRIRGRVWVVDASMIGQVGKTGDAWRLHMAFDLIAGRVGQVHLTDRSQGERLGHFHLQPGDLVLLDGGYGYRQTLKDAMQMGADVLLPFTPHTCPFEDYWGRAIDGVGWLRQAGPSSRARLVYWSYEHEHGRVRIIAKRRSAHQQRAAEHKLRRNARQKGHEPSAVGLFLCQWMVLMTTLSESAWTADELFSLYRARWQVELVFKRMKQLMDFSMVQATSREGAEATLRAQLVAWLLHEPTAHHLRESLSSELEVEHEAEQETKAVVSTWLLTMLVLSTLRQQVMGSWSEARLRECLPRLRRYIVSRTRRPHQESEVRAFLRGLRLNPPRHERAAA